MIFTHCTKSTYAIDQNRSRGFDYLATTSLLRAVLKITHGKRALYLFKMSSNFAQSNKMKTNLAKLIMKQVIKVRKVKQSGALQ